jgi:hypothetical protein
MQVTNEGQASEVDDLLYFVGDAMREFFIDRGAQVVRGIPTIGGEEIAIAIRVLTSLTGGLLKRSASETRKNATLAALQVLARHAGYIATIDDLVEAEFH